ncbi:saccharopine dehydrogenase NADP-binding domain-containing protein [Streptosporangium sp. NPDC002721]|uniref:saccharopine dehydrogenase NADP-binding domain-containing protein n=1 Tax=Streptosporangium sp. NPDC002721 TaxID=3366188 RepID=UPI00369DC9E6
MIGIVGGYGAVGGAAARLLAGHGVRVGGRDLEAARRFVSEELGGRGEAWEVDAYDEAGLARFCRGCTVVVNCAGPSYLLLDRVARASFLAGADYVDAAGDGPVFDRLAATGTAGATAVLSAGMLPGLTGLLPRHLARFAGAGPHRLDVYTGGLDRLTPAAAGDVLLSGRGDHGEALAAWRGGGTVSRALSPAYGVELPYFHGPVTAYPFLGTEAARVAGELGLEEARWYNVITGDRVLAAMSAAVSAADLMRVAELELAGRTPYYVLLFQLSGPGSTRTMALRAADSYELTAAVVAHTTEAVLRGEVGAGPHYADGVLDPAGMLADLEPVAKIEVSDDIPRIDLAAPAFEEGAL